MRRRLNLTVLAVTAMVTLAFLIPLGAVVKVVAADRALSVANQEARSLSSILASQTPASALVSVVQELNENGMGRQATVFLPDGKKVGPAMSVPAAELAVARRGKAFTTSSNSETRIWVPVRVRSGVIVGLVNVPDQLLEAGVLGAWAVLAGVAVCVLLLALLLSDRLGRSLVLSIKNLESVTRRLSEGQLDARVKPAGPVEIEDMGRAVNRLGERIIELLALEREQAADLSHRLRTPLAALALEADTLNDEGDRQRIRSTVHELTEEVNSVIVQVRQVRPIKVPEICDATETVRERLTFWSVLAEEQRRPWTSDLPDTELAVPLPGSELGAAVDSLIGNVMAHTPDRTPFRVTLTATETTAVLVVEDEGPGFPEGWVDRRGLSGGGSTGLGLDIVRRTAERAHGSVNTGFRLGGGAMVQVTLGRAEVAEAHPTPPRRTRRRSNETAEAETAQVQN
jgi:signal transduction histidine kinase